MEDVLGGSAERIPAAVHGQSTGVSGFTVEVCRDTALARDCRNDAHRQVLRLEHRALLDVNFAVTEQVARVPFLEQESFRIASKCADGLGHRDPLLVLQRKMTRIEASCHNLAPEIGRVVAEAFFVGKGDDLDGEG